jgi:hypothetical protein
MATTQAPSQQITDEVTSWPGVEGGPGSRGEYEDDVRDVIAVSTVSGLYGYP